MYGKQRAIYDALVLLAGRVEEGWYGEDNNFNKDDFVEDIEDDILRLVD
jgi:hypothetical protein